MNREQLEKDVLNLSLSDRVHLAEKLLHSLDSPSLPISDAEWIIEAERRFSELKSGRVSGIASSLVLKELREMLK